MSYYKDIWRIINGADTSTGRDSKGALKLNNGLHFRSMSVSSQNRLVSRVNDAQREIAEKLSQGEFLEPSDVRASVGKALEPITKYTVENIGAGQEAVQRVMDSMFGFNLNMAPGTMPQFGGMSTPNLWIDPGEAALIYAGGGLPTTIINKKSQSIAYNGVRIVNPELSDSDMERVNESAQKTGLARALADAARDGLVYGGSLLFPIFKRDVPATLLMSVEQLANLDVVGKGCIDRYVVLDRNNAIHIPNWNPTADDFLNPRYYFIPYLGSDVMGQRCARIVPFPQAGYWGAIMSMGWGVSDIQNWYKAVCNYEGVADAVPSMIKQMSLLVRTFNVDLVNAMNGITSLKEMDAEDLLTVRQASNENPISMDVIGDLKAVERDFTAVAELTRIVRQDVAVKANMPEEQLWSSDRGAFSSGDQTDGMNERQWEGMKYVHGEIEKRSKNLAMLEVINALGKDRDVRKALAATRIVLLPPKIENATKRADLVGTLSTAVFDLVASGMQLDSALSIVLPYGDEHLTPTSEVMQKIELHEKEVDERDKIDHDLDVELKKKQIEAPVAQPGVGGAAPKPKTSDAGKGYSPLEQRKHEKTRGGDARREGLARAKGKKL